MRLVLAGQSGPYAPPVLCHLLTTREFAPVLVIEGRHASEQRATHRLYEPTPRELPKTTHLTDLGRAAGIPVLETNDINAKAAIAMVRRHEPDVLVCAGFDRLFTPALLAVFRQGAINLHPSLLPRWRGPSPLFWAAKHRDLLFGVTIHALDHRADHGPIYAQAPFRPLPRASSEDLYRLAATIAAPMLVTVLRMLHNGTLRGVTQDDSAACRAPRPKAEDVCVVPRLWAAEHLVDFCSIAPFFRAPWIRFGNDTFFVRRGLLAEPGRTLGADYSLVAETLVVQCRDGLAHLEIQI